MRWLFEMQCMSPVHFWQYSVYYYLQSVFWCFAGWAVIVQVFVYASECVWVWTVLLTVTLALTECFGESRGPTLYSAVVTPYQTLLTAAIAQPLLNERDTDDPAASVEMSRSTHISHNPLRHLLPHPTNPLLKFDVTVSGYKHSIRCQNE